MRGVPSTATRSVPPGSPGASYARPVAAAELGQPVGLRGYARLVWSRKWTVVFTTLVVFTLVLAFIATQRREYTSTAEVLLSPTLSRTGLLGSGLSSAASVDIPTDIAYFQSSPVRAAAGGLLHTSDPPGVSVAQVGITDVVEVSATSPDPAEAAAVANAYVTAFQQVQRSATVSSLLDVEQQVQARLNAVQAQLTAIGTQLSSAPAVDVPALQATQTSLVSQQAALQGQLTQLQLTAAVATGGGQVIQPAQASSVPSSPDVKRWGAVGLLAGLVIGVGAARIQEMLDDTVRSEDDAVRCLPDLPVLAQIPMVAEWKNRRRPGGRALAPPGSPAAEAYRALRTAVQFAVLDRPLRVLQVTSPASGEGKTSTSANLAATLAQAGTRTVLACCDLRHPRAGEILGVSHPSGLTSVVVGEEPLSAAFEEVPGQENLVVLGPGPLPPNPSELLGSARTAGVFTSLRAAADLVVVDSPPVLPVTDAAVVSRLADAVLLVVEVGVTTRRQLRRAAELLRHVDAPIIGMVLNKVPLGETYTYHRGGYGYPYAPAADSLPSRNGVRATQPAPQVAQASQNSGVAVGPDNSVSQAQRKDDVTG